MNETAERTGARRIVWSDLEADHPVGSEFHLVGAQEIRADPGGVLVAQPRSNVEYGVVALYVDSKGLA